MPGFRGARRSEGINTHAHREERKRWAAILEQAGALPCTRCRLAVTPGMAWHLDHNDDRQTYRGVAHARCNVKAGASLGGRRAAARKAVREGRTTLNRW